MDSRSTELRADPCRKGMQNPHHEFFNVISIEYSNCSQFSSTFLQGTVASKNGGFGWFIHGMDEAHDSQSSSRILYVVSALAAEALTLKVALPSASSAGFSKLQVILDSIVLFSALHSGMDLNEIAGCSLATLFSPLPFNFYQCTTLCLAVAIAMCVFFKLCSSITIF
ncbi:Uncharacterized protein Rs2_12184 [Raphanus sativus]|uniref:Uncharacterized protein LOC108839182 n=1 Tax=Raphanus sativus TaxID=3726 RepID=A0A6J0M6D3_RAPSA|nr:uncharacterized protein LOC108839182 [Raphanus sativus]KAJ4908526.1 Uncharacterized protein Rs2_12184 [Raphanus sativus]